MTSQASNAELRALVKAGDAEGLQTALGSLSAGALSTFLGDTDIMGRTPLHFASLNGHDAVAETLLEKGGEVNAKAMYDWTPLHLASLNGHDAVAETLLEKGGEVNAKDAFGGTPLHLASLNGHHAVAETLLEKGGEVNAKDKDGETAMHLAAWKGHTAVLEVLQEGGANVDAADFEGDTPLHKAASRRHLLAIFTLMKFGASTYKKNKTGRTPQDLMPRSSSTESRGMELFQSVSMTHVMQKWVATEKERIRLQREIQVLKVSFHREKVSKNRNQKDNEKMENDQWNDRKNSYHL
ncbi:26S proteasome non-ATPase regulatory subunit 10-like [Penaeus japonicus]|uniref:26S proteasome non-ATPase regulatory subunit 10-like n=1 Tax=Penaeus japonicus TaxID=27405 RepID=UPI001C70E454|nr:26S proteasome non-ATPase regulatory subunit 10-like [Penaeus japonicus]